MRKKELNQIRTKSKEELEKLLGEKKKELANLTAEMSSGKHKNVRARKSLRRDIAQLKTVLIEKEAR